MTEVVSHPEHIEALCTSIATVLRSRQEILDAYLFGSQATGMTHSSSDVDVAVYLLEPRPTRPWGYPADLATDLIATLGRNDVDVVVLNDAQPLLYGRILREGMRILTRDLAATTLRETRAMSRYFDWLPQLAKIRAVLDARIDAGEFGR